MTMRNTKKELIEYISKLENPNTKKELLQTQQDIKKEIKLIEYISKLENGIDYLNNQNERNGKIFENLKEENAGLKQENYLLHNEINTDGRAKYILNLEKENAGYYEMLKENEKEMKKMEELFN